MTSAMGPDFSKQVVEGAKACLDAYCRSLPPSDAARVVELQVQAAVALSEHDERVLRSDAERVADQFPMIRVETYLLPPDPQLKEEAPHFVVTPDLRDDTPAAEPQPSPVPLYDRQLLTLSYGTASLSYLLTPSPDWIPVRRREPDYDHSREIVIPGSMPGLSREPLVELCLEAHDALDIRRTSHQPGIEVFVDGRPLRQRPLPLPRGRLTFAAGHNRTEIEYRLTPWRDESLRPGTGRVSGVAAPQRTALDVGESRGWLDVDPPAVEVAPRATWFRVRAPRFAGGEILVPVEVLYTTGTSSADGLDGRRWFVKMFRTATPQHADFLRNQFGRQAEAVRDVIVNGGGSIAAPPWGIAPIHVIDPRESTGQRIEPTRIGAPPLTSADDVVFGEWFGAPDGAPADCFVLVAAPLLAAANVEREPAGPALLHLPRFRAMANALDRCHRRRIAHCDLKPDNYRKEGSDYVLVDGDSVTELDSEPPAIPFTPPYANAYILRHHEGLAHDDKTLHAEQIREHDRFGFGLLVLGALVGSGWVRHNARGKAGERTIDDRTRLRDALRLRWGSDSRWNDLIDRLTEAFDPAAVHREDWTCAGWLDQVLAAATAPVQVETAPAEPDYMGPYDTVLASIREEILSRQPNPTQALSAVDEVIARRAARITAWSYRRWLFGLGAIGTLVFVLFVSNVASSLGWI